MLKIFRFVRNLYLLKQKRVAEEQRQQAEGYSVTFEQHGPERYITYLEGDREINVIAEFSMFNDVILFTDSLVKWSVPNNELLSEFDHLRLVNRMIRYFSCWGEMTLDNRRLPASEEFMLELQKAGIAYEELPGGIIHYSVEAEDERKRKGGFFDR